MDTRSVETTIVGVRICKFVTHSEVNKSISQRQTNFYRFSEIISIRVHRLSEVNAATLKFNSTFLRGSFDYYSLQLAHVWGSQRRLEDFRYDYECRRWMRRVFDSSRSLLFKPLSSQGGLWAFNEWILRAKLWSNLWVNLWALINKSTYESNIRLNKAIRNISRTTDQAIISNQNTLVAKQNETQ